MKTYSSLVKIISDGENNCKQNKCSKWVKYRNVLPNHKNANMGNLQFNITLRFLYILWTLVGGGGGLV